MDEDEYREGEGRPSKRSRVEGGAGGGGGGDGDPQAERQPPRPDRPVEGAGDGDEDSSGMMECAVIGEIGQPLAKSLLIERRPRPLAAPGEVVVQVLAAGVNPSDVGALRGAFPYTRPGVVAGRDCCGRVVDGPADLLGKIVWSGGGKDRGIADNGGLSQYTRLPVDACIPLPKGVSVAQAGTMGVPLVTAACATAKVNIQAGETVAINGANGQVGRFLLQIARWKGAKTIAIVRRKMTLQWADVVVDSSQGDLVETLRRVAPAVNAVVDCVGVDTGRFIDVLAPHGRLVILAAKSPTASFPLPIRQFYRKDLTLHSTETMQHSAGKSAEMIRGVMVGFESGALTAPSLHHEIFTLTRVREAYALVGNGCPSRVVVAPNGLEALASSSL